MQENAGEKAEDAEDQACHGKAAGLLHGIRTALGISGGRSRGCLIGRGGLTIRLSVSVLPDMGLSVPVLIRAWLYVLIVSVLCRLRLCVLHVPALIRLWPGILGVLVLCRSRLALLCAGIHGRICRRICRRSGKAHIRALGFIRTGGWAAFRLPVGKAS